MRKAIHNLLRILGTLVLLVALVGAGSCGVYSAQSVEFGNMLWAFILFGVCCILALLIKIIWTKPRDE